MDDNSNGQSMNGYRVGESPIHGRGLFATHTIADGARIGAYEGPPAEYDSTYVLWVEDDDGVWHGILGENELRYLNHSSRPNAAFEGADLYAMRAIAADEEITIHYGDDWDHVD